MEWNKCNKCNKCGKCFKRKWHLKRHMEKRKTPCVKEPKKHICEKCNKEVSNSSSLSRHRKSCLNKTRPSLYTPPNESLKELGFIQTPHAIGKYLRGWQADVQETLSLASDPIAFLEGVKHLIKDKLEREIDLLGGVMFHLASRVKLSKEKDETESTFRNTQETVLVKSEISNVIDNAFAAILKTFELWTQRGSGWQFDHVVALWLDIAKYQPLKGGSYVDLPEKIKNKKAIINVKNKDDNCLRCALS